MDHEALVGKYLRLRQELTASSAADHRSRVLSDMKTLELQLARSDVRQFADTEPLAVDETLPR